MIQTAILILVVLASDYVLYRLLCKKLERKPEQPAVQSKPSVPKKADDADVDNKASNAERLYLEGLQSILSYDVDTMKKYLRGVDEE